MAVRMSLGESRPVGAPGSYQTNHPGLRCAVPWAIESRPVGAVSWRAAGTKMGSKLNSGRQQHLADQVVPAVRASNLEHHLNRGRASVPARSRAEPGNEGELRS